MSPRCELSSSVQQLDEAVVPR
uniref:Uncharacterized protein n=1 Tax=Arundo donax TaxID=35708 RepID=A0A0A8YAC2_ARUDO